MVNYKIVFIGDFHDYTILIDGVSVGTTIQKPVYSYSQDNAYLEIDSKILSSGSHSIYWGGGVNHLTIENLDQSKTIVDVEEAHGFSNEGLWFDESGIVPAIVNSKPTNGWKGYLNANLMAAGGFQAYSAWDQYGNPLPSQDVPLDPSFIVIPNPIGAYYNFNTNTLDLPPFPSTPPITSYDVIIEATNGKTLEGTISSQDYQQFSSSVITLISGGSQYTGSSFIISKNPSSSIPNMVAGDIVNFLVNNVNMAVVTNVPINPVNNTTAPVNESSTQPQQTSLGQPLLSAPIPNPPIGTNVITDVLIPTIPSTTPNTVTPTIPISNIINPSNTSIGSSLQNILSGTNGIILLIVIVVILAVIAIPRSQPQVVYVK